MSALAVYFEREGLATAVVGLIRLHLEKIRPPRALWVPFELGRPLGAYVAQGEFQKDVLRHALTLLDREQGPAILEDFPFDDPGALDDEQWQAPAINDTNSLLEEVQQLQPLWRQSIQNLGASMTGLSGMSVEQAANYIEKFDTDNPAINPDDSLTDVLRLRFCADDIKTYYCEVALLNGLPSSRQIATWFWHNTQAARTLKSIRENNLDHENAIRASVCGRSLIPGAIVF